MFSKVLRDYYGFSRHVEQCLSDQGHLGVTAEMGMLLQLLGDKELTINELYGSCYFGTNVSYNVKRLVEQGFLSKFKADEDGRLFLVKATKAGKNIARIVLDAEKTYDKATA